MWLEDIILDFPNFASYWPSVLHHEPKREQNPNRSAYHAQNNVRNHASHGRVSHSAALRQAKGLERGRKERKRPSTKSSAGRQIVPSKSRACHAEQPTKREQEDAEEIVRDIIGPHLIKAPTVQMILKLQATRMDPLEWISIRRAIEIEPKAGKSLLLLARLLDKDAKATAQEEADKGSAIWQSAERHELFVEKWREARRLAGAQSN
jgi:hypothetical protein